MRLFPTLAALVCSSALAATQVQSAAPRAVVKIRQMTAERKQ